MSVVAIAHALASVQHGAISRAQLFDLSVSIKAIERALEKPETLRAVAVRDQPEREDCRSLRPRRTMPPAPPAAGSPASAPALPATA